ncbi:superoxide dismutase [Phenylobacterium deserti]|uniref:Superoxide dismutase n=1 Tax=Phenylobacterium deserti TaxID=1914756 RepID=A0A328ATC9_9CAUL|nr:superoxide dismutase [Phenylobacterium deserti]RAK56946.1 superoxide dismutase [Fe] [Phenylobacterium deserti]
MIRLPELPYAYEALQPTVSSETMHIHHDKHHAKYVDVANGLVSELGLEGLSVEELVTEAERREHRKLFNNAAQSWNHAFFWDSMTPNYRGPQGELADAITQAFGSLENLRTKFVEEGANHFASGWAWLAAGDQGLVVLSTHDGGTLANSAELTPLLLCDVWEHAYYVDYRQDRKTFLEKWFDTVANWELAEQQFAARKSGGQTWRYPA